VGSFRVFIVGFRNLLRLGFRNPYWDRIMYLAGLIGQICASTAHYRLTKACGPNVIVFGHYNSSKKNSTTSLLFHLFSRISSMH
jgi:hypothetical protein